MSNVRIKVSVAIFAFVLLICSFAVFVSPSVAYAAGTIYSDVLEDLRTDGSFSTEQYPAVADDYSLKVIQIAESSDKELFVYVYQPCGLSKKITASSINISLVPRENISDVKNYKLRLLSSNGVFYKYLVEGLTVNTSTTRYYTIPSILRPYDKTIDKGADYGNEVTEVVYEVAKEYCFSTINGEPFCRVLDVETIEITDKFVGFVRYEDGYHPLGWYSGACDSHFVAFSTDRDIDRLLEADVYYTSQSYEWDRSFDWLNPVESFGEKVDNYAYLTYEQKVEHTGGGWFAPTYTWNRIQSVDEFIAGENIEQDVYTGALFNVSVANKITDEGMEALQNKQWVLRFVETAYYSSNSDVGSMYKSSTIVGDVTILRLKFETDGITYNLGVIDNKQSGNSDVPINEQETNVELSDPMKWVLLAIALVLLVILCVLLAPVLPYIIKFIIWLISLPFRAVAKLVDTGKKLKETGSVQNARKKKPVKTIEKKLKK